MWDRCAVTKVCVKQFGELLSERIWKKMASYSSMTQVTSHKTHSIVARTPSRKEIAEGLVYCTWDFCGMLCGAFTKLPPNPRALVASYPSLG